MRRLFIAVILVLLSHAMVDAADPLPDIRDINPDLTIPESTDGKLAAGRRIKCFSTTDNKQLYHVLYLPTVGSQTKSIRSSSNGREMEITKIVSVTRVTVRLKEVGWGTA